MKRIFTLFIIITFCSCKHESVDKLYKLFPDSTRYILEKQGYKRVWGIDVVMYEKQVNDVLFQFQFYDGDGEELGYQMWVNQNFFFSDKDEYEKKLRELGFHPYTPVNINETVAVINNETHGIYLSYYYPKEGKLTIIYQHPVSN